ncbi:MAG: hypothetical protein ABJO52_14410 [Nisaea sp.]|uniref:hypothetical protein n=1 Tax=Nisaea sp. TaxID=2024842 RepID=UPI003298BD2C
MLIEKGAEVEVVTPERFFAPEIGGLNHVAYAKALHQSASRITINTQLKGVSRNGNELLVTLGGIWGTDGDPCGGSCGRRTRHPADGRAIFRSRSQSRNLGAVDYKALIRGEDAFPAHNPEAGFTLARIGDAVAFRNIHASIYDGLRFAKDL